MSSSTIQIPRKEIYSPRDLLHKIVYPAVRLGKHITKIGDVSFLDPTTYREAPSLEELRRALVRCNGFHTTIPKDVSEATCTFITLYKDGRNPEINVRPEYIEQYGDGFVLEGGQLFVAGKDCDALPTENHGWATSYDNATGLPSNSYKGEEGCRIAKEHFNDLASPFMINTDLHGKTRKTLIVTRGFPSVDSGPYTVHAYLQLQKSAVRSVGVRKRLLPPF